RGGPHAALRTEHSNDRARPGFPCGTCGAAPRNALDRFLQKNLVQRLFEYFLRPGSNRLEEDLRVQRIGHEEQRDVRRVQLEAAGRAQRLVGVEIREVEHHDPRTKLTSEQEPASKLG